jgi:tripartite-type tricarboxylate transporter receptor subunit TctC
MNKRLACVLLGLAWACAASAEYPEKPVRMIVPYPAAGAADIAARIIAERLAERWKQPVVVENRPGATGVIGVQALMASPPDGYTLILHATAGFTIYPASAKKPVYDPLKDMTPITPVAYSVLVAVVPASLPVNDMKAFLDYARKNPGKLSYGSAGIGAMNHIGMELLKLRAGLDLAHVPYKGDAPVVADMLNGNVTFSLLSSNVAIPQVRAGKLKGLAVTSRTRAESVPELPTQALERPRRARRPAARRGAQGEPRRRRDPRPARGAQAPRGARFRRRSGVAGGDGRAYPQRDRDVARRRQAREHCAGLSRPAP